MVPNYGFLKIWYECVPQSIFVLKKARTSKKPTASHRTRAGNKTAAFLTEQEPVTRLQLFSQKNKSQ
jgi:hypothetical protein